ncbi:MAG: hypothetical protein UU56_C0002G0109 [Candidatus Curtissbacteria bacterium GW2011_GWA2_41_24]|uniref:Clp R domain-containing protein n=3 Tax=Candidatus Curtissiibacteriota TaxID=1752717 RepID=A0A0G0VVV4_9BACT|nr:MAG: hypothetical protein UU56_C0002G0109 [Candidatus Curtissbacteria bacterium GW2011_GWA2_41_24]
MPYNLASLLKAMNEFDRGFSKFEEALVSPAVKDILDLVRQEAERVRFPFVDSGLLLWIIVNKNKEAANLLSRRRNTRQTIMDALLPVALDRPVLAEEIELTAESYQALIKAAEIATGYGSNQVKWPHLLLALTQIKGGLAKGVLTREGVNLKKLTERTDRYLNSSSVTESTLA